MRKLSAVFAGLALALLAACSSVMLSADSEDRVANAGPGDARVMEAVQDLNARDARKAK